MQFWNDESICETDSTNPFLKTEFEVLPLIPGITRAPLFVGYFPLNPAGINGVFNKLDSSAGRKDEMNGGKHYSITERQPQVCHIVALSGVSSQATQAPLRADRFNYNAPSCKLI